MTASTSGWCAPLAEVRPVVVESHCSAMSRELEQQHVPRLLALREAGARERRRVADRQRDEVVDAIGRERARSPTRPPRPSRARRRARVRRRGRRASPMHVDRRGTGSSTPRPRRACRSAVAAQVGHDHLEARPRRAPGPGCATAVRSRGSRAAARPAAPRRSPRTRSPRRSRPPAWALLVRVVGQWLSGVEQREQLDPAGAGDGVRSPPPAADLADASDDRRVGQLLVGVARAAP